MPIKKFVCVVLQSQLVSALTRMGQSYGDWNVHLVISHAIKTHTQRFQSNIFMDFIGIKKLASSD